MNLLFILPEFYPTVSGGICTYYQELLKENNACGKWNITIVQGSAVDTRSGEANWEGVPIHYLTLNLLNKYKRLFNKFSILPELQNHLASAWGIYELANQLNKKFDAVIATDWGLGFVPWIIKQELPVIVHLHGSIGQIDHYEPRLGSELLSNLYLTIENTLLPYANALVTHSNQNMNFWKQRFLIEPNFSIVPPAISTVNYNPLKETGLVKRTGLVIARIQFWKGVIQLCEAISLLDNDKRSNLKIFWIGRDTSYSATNSSMNEFLNKTYPHIWGKIIEPVGEKNHAEIETFYNSTSWTLVPSTWDMFNLSALEHLNHKKPLICSTGAGVSDFLTSDHISLFNNTPAGLAYSIKKFLEMPEAELSEIGQKSHLVVTEKFKPAFVYKQHMTVIESAIKGFHKKTHLEKSLSWLTPETTALHAQRAKETLLSTWPVREITKLFFKRLRSKIKI